MNSPIAGNPFSTDGNWYRGSVHNHTLASDGRHSVAELSKWYQDQGMDFIVITDHNVVADVSEADDLDITVIPGSEIGVCWDEALVAEILCLGIDEVRRTHVHPQEVINDVLEQGGLPYMSHPYLSGVYSALMMDLDGLVGLEMFNLVADGMGNRGWATTHVDDLMAVGRIVWGLATDDRHAIGEDGPTAWIEVKADSNDRETILGAMRRGLYYSTTGPKIHDLAFGDTKLNIKCSGAQRITLSTLPWFSQIRDADSSGPITEVSVTLKFLQSLGPWKDVEEFMQAQVEEGALTTPKDLKLHVRIEIDDGQGGWASTNPMPIPGCL